MLLLKSREAAAAACRVVNKFYSISLSSSAHYYSSSSSSALIDFSQEISAAVKQRGVGELNRVVALESTIISHGMPWPSNMEMALEVEQIIRKQGAIPATIALMNGRIKVGLTMDELERLAKVLHVLLLLNRHSYSVLTLDP